MEKTERKKYLRGPCKCFHHILYPTINKKYIEDQLKLNVAREVKNNKKGFCECIHNKTKGGDNVRPLLSETADLVTQTWKRLRCERPPLPRSLIARLAFRNSKSQRLGGTCGARKMYP